jgi:hypothetical protein
MKTCLNEKLLNRRGQYGAGRQIMGNLIRKVADRSRYPPNLAEIVLLEKLAPRLKIHRLGTDFYFPDPAFSHLGIVISSKFRERQETGW